MQSPTTPQTTVEEYDPASVSPPPGNRPVSPSDVENLLPTMGDPAIGQRQPGIVCDDPACPGRFLALAGVRRLIACRILGIRFKAIKVAGPVSALDMIRIRLTENVLRQAMTPREVAADVEAYIKLANVSQAEAGAHFGFSAAKVSKLLSLKRLIPELHALVDNGTLCGDVARIIGTLETPEQQRELADRAVRNCMKRDAVEKVAAAMRGSRRNVPVRDRKLKAGPAVVTVPGDWTNQQAAEALAELVKQLRRGDGPGVSVSA